MHEQRARTVKELPGADKTREASGQQGRARRDLDTGLPPSRPIQTGERDARCGRLDEEEGGRGRRQPHIAAHPMRRALFHPLEESRHKGEAIEELNGPGHVGSHSTQIPARRR